MNLKILNRFELDGRIKNLAKAECELLHQVLLTIKEIDSRKAYLEFGFSSLYAYLTEEVGYSEGAAQRRIAGARLLRDVPSLGEKIVAGEIGLSQITLIQKAVREVFARTSVTVTSDDKEQLLDQIVNMNQKDSQIEVAQFFDIPVIHETRQTLQADESLRVTLTIPKELNEKIKVAQGYLSHALPENDLLKYLEYVTDRVIKQKTSVRPVKNQTVKSKNEEGHEFKGADDTVPESTATAAVDQQGSDSNSFSSRDKKIILKQLQCCQYVDPVTRRTCGSRWFVQIDHKQSRWADGTGVVDNGNVLCGAHNRMKYRREAGIKLSS